jgi:hypothetical protein
MIPNEAKAASGLLGDNMSERYIVKPAAPPYRTADEVWECDEDGFPITYVKNTLSELNRLAVLVEDIANLVRLEERKKLADALSGRKSIEIERDYHRDIARTLSGSGKIAGELEEGIDGQVLRELLNA